MTSISSRDMLLAQIREALAPAIPSFLAERRWFGGKARTLRSVEVSDIVPLMHSPFEAFLAVVRVTYVGGPGENYSLPLILESPEAPLPAGAPFLKVRTPGEPRELVLYDAMLNESFLDFLFDAIVQGKSFAGESCKVSAIHTGALSELWQPSHGRLQPVIMNVEQSNTSVVFGKRLVLKLFRHLEEGINPDEEIGAFLTNARFPNSAAVAGYLEYAADNHESSSLGLLQAFVVNRGDAWKLTLNDLANYYDRAGQISTQDIKIPQRTVLALAGLELGAEVQERIGSYLELARLLARRTAELHLVLAGETDDPAFSPQPFGNDELHDFCTSSLELVGQTFELLGQRQHLLHPNTHQLVERVLASEQKTRNRLESLSGRTITAMRTRIHGDYHLGQVLFTGDDFVIIDFEGEPARSLSERRAKRSPLQDVAGMLRSFHYAAYAPLVGDPATTGNLKQLAPHARYWQTWVSAAFLRTYLDTSGDAGYIPRSQDELQTLLDAYLLDKAMYELRYELNNRPQWVAIPLEGIASLMSTG
jgi:maltose alpha-D-glucosyltransferase / alpha-amylase